MFDSVKLVKGNLAMAKAMQNCLFMPTLRTTIVPKVPRENYKQLMRTSVLCYGIGVHIPALVFRPYCGARVHPHQQSECDLNDMVGKLVANVQLLSVITALSLAIGVAKCGAFCPASASTTKNVQTSYSKKIFHEPYLSDTEGTPTTGMTEIRDDEDVSGGVDYRSNPYSITVPLRVVGLRGSIPPTWLKDFLGSQGKRVRLTAEFRASLKSIFSELSSALKSQQLNFRSAMSADLVTIGDSWLSKAVCGGLIRPIENAEQCEWYHRMGSKWQNFVRRDEQGHVNPNGKVWGVPYRLGSLIIAYNREKFERHGISPITDWVDLWNPQLAGRISMVASPREVVGVVLKALGAPLNVKSFEEDVRGGRQAMEEKFLALKKQVRLFDDMLYLKTLGADEVWVAVGWSHDVISFAQRTSNIAITAPLSGTSLWADLWAVPAATSISSDGVGGRTRGPSPLVLQWFDFCLQPARVNSYQGNVLMGASPLALSNEVNTISQVPGLLEDRLSSPVEVYAKNGEIGIQHEQRDSYSKEGFFVETILRPSTLDNSEFLEPLSDTALQDFRWLLSRRPEKSGKTDCHP